MAGVKQVRNKKLLPSLSKEGILTQEINLATKEKHGVPAGIRLYSHHTLASVRRLSFYHPLYPPNDSLDLILASTYNHSIEKFADKEDLYLQLETLGCDTWRRLRNTFDKLPPVVVPLGHPMKTGGIMERKSPFSVKLMNSGVHSSQTNPGFSRQPAGDCDNKPQYKKSHRVRSWYLYEQFKSLEHNQLDAARKLKDRSYQDRALRQELSERKARRILYDQVGLCQSDSGIERVRSESTRDSLNTDDFFESFHELQEDEDLDQMVSPDLLGACSQDSPNGKFYDDDFKSADEPTNEHSSPESVVSVVDAKSSVTVAGNLKNYLEFEKEAKLEDLDVSLDDINEKLACFERLAKLRNFDNFSVNEDSLYSAENEQKHKRMRDKDVNTLDNNVNIMWTKLVTFAYQIIESNHGNFYYDYGSQLLTAVLACDVLRRGINRMCHILQPYVSPIKFAAESESSFESYKNVKRKKTQRSEKFRTRHYKRYLRNYSLPKTRMKSFVTKRYHPENWERHSLPFFGENKNYIKTYQASEPWQSAPKLSINRRNPQTKSSYHRHWPLFLSDNNIKRDLCKLACSCHCHKVVNPMLRLSLYLDRIMRDIDDPISY